MQLFTPTNGKLSEQLQAYFYEILLKTRTHEYHFLLGIDFLFSNEFWYDGGV